MSLMKGVIAEIMKDVKGNQAQRYAKPKGIAVTIQKSEAKEPEGEEDELAKFLKDAASEEKGKPGEDWMHDEEKDSPMEKKIEKEAGLEGKPSFESFEDKMPDWMDDPEVMEKVFKMRSKKLEK